MYFACILHNLLKLYLYFIILGHRVTICHALINCQKYNFPCIYLGLFILDAIKLGEEQINVIVFLKLSG